jgi:hypothetical protein
VVGPGGQMCIAPRLAFSPIEPTPYPSAPIGKLEGLIGLWPRGVNPGGRTPPKFPPQGAKPKDLLPLSLRTTGKGCKPLA